METAFSLDGNGHLLAADQSGAAFEPKGINQGQGSREGLGVRPVSRSSMKSFHFP